MVPPGLSKSATAKGLLILIYGQLRLSIVSRNFLLLLLVLEDTLTFCDKLSNLGLT